MKRSEMRSRNASQVAYAQRRGDRLVDATVSAKGGALAGTALSLILNAPALAIALACAVAAVAAVAAFFRPRKIDCSLCDTTLAAASGRCPGCAASIRGRR